MLLIIDSILFYQYSEYLLTVDNVFYVMMKVKTVYELRTRQELFVCFVGLEQVA